MTKPTRLFDFIAYQKEHYPQVKAYNTREGDEWIHYSTDDVIDMGNKVSRGLLALGVQKGDKIVIATYRNRPEWVFMDLGISQIGAVSVPVYPTISTKDYNYIFNNAEVTYAFVGEGDLYDKVIALDGICPSLKKVYTFDQVEKRPFWEEIFTDEGQDEVEAIKASVSEDDMATIIYTSGTTGTPKGVMLSHKNIASSSIEATTLITLPPGSRALSFLPLCHIFERSATYFQTYIGANVYYVGVKNLGGEDGDIQAVKPHTFNTVPRLLEKVYEKIYQKGDSLTGAKRKLFFWAMAMTEEYEFDKEYKGLDKIKFNIADKLIFSKWREALGGNVKIIISGAAALPAKIAQVFSAAGIPVREGYGLTETSPGLAIGRLTKGGAKMGCVGPALDYVDLYIDDSDGTYNESEGEILAHGPNVMMGYYNKPEETAAVFKEVNGKRYFRTGDIGKFVAGDEGHSFLKITDRKKELLKTSGGKYVAPSPIESKMKEDFMIEQAMVVGEKRKFVSALVIPAKEALQAWCGRNDIVYTTMDDLIDNEKVIDAYQRIIQEVNQNFSHTEQIKKFKLLDQEWLPVRDDDTEAELTPTMKLKRRVINKKCEDIINNLYHN